jgi:acetylornithine deacetylase
VTELAELLRQLVAIDSTNPELVPGGAGEGEIARFVASWCERAGLAVEVEEPAPGRPNVIATVQGTGGGRSLMLNAHMDTVGVAGMDEPFSGRIDGGRLYGRGAYDMKAGLAAMMVAGAAAVPERLRGDVVLTAVADEEYKSVGTESVARRLRAEAAIVTEPTELRVGVAHKGMIWLELETAGRAAHGSRPHLGDDAILKMAPAIAGLADLDLRLRAGRAHPLVGPPSLHASTIEGGREWSIYPDCCVLRVERRTIPGETLEEVEAEVREVAGAASVRVELARLPHEIRDDEEIVDLLARHAGTDRVGVSYWADSALLGAAGIPTVLFGPAGEGAHAAVEWVDLASVERCAEVYLAVAEEFCA